MLRIHKTSNSLTAIAYYDQNLSKDGQYYLAKGIISHWHGLTAQRLDLLRVQVDKDTFAKLLSNINPNTGDKLKVRNRDNQRCGYDAVYSAVKSASIVYALTDDKAIFDIHVKAYQAAMVELEQYAMTQANTGYGRFNEQTSNIIYSPFDHLLSRPVPTQYKGREVQAPDMQLHTHCYTMAVTWSHEKQRYQALETGAIFARAPMFEAVYHSVFSRELQQAGYAIERNNKSYEIKGVDRDLIEKFSKRTLQIEKTARDKNITEAKEKAKLGALTRKSKSDDLSLDELKAIWKDRLSDSEYEALLQIKDQHKSTDKIITPAFAVDQALEHFFERSSVIETHKVITQALKTSYGQCLIDDIRKEIAKRKDLVFSDQGGMEYLTSHEMIRSENALIKNTVSGKGKYLPLNDSYQIKADILNKGQRKAIDILLNSKSQFMALRGVAGSGKTTLLKEIQAAVQESGKELYAYAQSAQASRDVLRSKGFEADTIAALLHSSKEEQDKVRDNVILIDEAGLVGTRTMSQLVSLAKDKNSRLVLAGDPYQHGPVEAGDGMRLLMNKAKIETAHVRNIVRQQPGQHKQAVMDLSRGRTLEAYQRLDKNGQVHEIEDHEQRLSQIATDYVQTQKSGQSVLAISPTNYEGRQLANAIRDELKKDGVIKGRERMIDTARDLSFTTAQKQDLVNYQHGQIIRVTRNQKGGLKAGQSYVVQSKTKDRVEVKDKTTGQLFTLLHKTPQNYGVYEPTQTPIAKGDTIRMGANLKTLEGSKVNTGNTYQVLGYNRNGDIKLSNKKTLAKDALFFKQGFVETSYSAQGKDCDQVLISMSDQSFAASGPQQMYVSVSRGKRSATIYTSSKDDLKKAISKSNQQLSATDLAKAAKRQTAMKIERERQRQTYLEKQGQTKDYGAKRQYSPTHKPSLSKDSKGFE